MRIAALFLGLIAGLFALLAPSAFRTDLMSPFLELWAANPSEHLLGSIVWYAIPVAALLGGLLSTVTPGFAALLLFGAAVGWVAIGLMLPSLFGFQLLAPAGAAGLGAMLAFLAGELEIRQRRMRRRNRLAATDAFAGNSDDDTEIEREAALRADPRAVSRDEAPPPPKRAIPLTLDEVAVTAHPLKPPPRWQDLDAPTSTRRGSDMWAEAIRPEAEPEIEPPPSPRRATLEPRHEFRWDEDDAPAGQRREATPSPSPRLEPRRSQPVAQPTVERSTPDLWPEVQRQRPMPMRLDAAPRRGGGLVAALAALGVVLGLGVVGAGGYIAYREGWVDGLVTLLQPRGVVTEAPQAVTPAPAPAPVDAPVAETPPQAAPAPSEVAAPPSAADVSLLQTAMQPAAATPPAPADTQAGATFDDPFAYCRAVGTIDYVDDRYAGPATVEAITRTLMLPREASRDRVRWRCVEGKLWACTSYAGPICDMAPTVAEMTAFCERNPNVQRLMAPSGSWGCADGHPKLPEGANWPVDQRGFLPMAWIVVEPDASPAG